MKKLISRLTAIVAVVAMTLCASCHKDDKDEEEYDPKQPVDKVLGNSDFTVTYPLDCSFKAYRTGIQVFGLASGNDSMEIYQTLDTLDRAVEVFYFADIHECDKNQCDELVDVLRDYFYCEDAGYTFEGVKNTKIGSYDAIQINASKEGTFVEQYIIYSYSKKKKFSILISLPQDKKEERYAELKDIVNTFKFK